MDRIATILKRVAITGTKLLAAATAVSACLLAAAMWLDLFPKCRRAEIDWTWHDSPVPTHELCFGDVDVRPVQRNGQDCLELYALKDGLPLGEGCPDPGAP